MDELARRFGASFRSEARHRGELRAHSIGGADLWLLKPMSYMNHSGDAVQSVATLLQDSRRSRSWSPTTSWISRPASVRLKQGGGAAGHNGMRDVIAQMGDAFWRLRIGIGHPGDRVAVLDYVLGRPPAAEAAADPARRCSRPPTACRCMLTDGAQKAMNRLHARDGAAPVPAKPEAD